MDVSTAFKSQNVDRPTTSSASPTDRDMALNNEVLCGRSQKYGDHQDSRRDDVSSGRDAASDPNTDMRYRSMSIDEISQPQKTENKQMDICDGGDTGDGGKGEMNRE